MSTSLLLSLSVFALYCVQAGGLPSIYCDICGKVYRSRDELVAHHSAVHKDSPALADQPQRANRSNSGDSAAHKDGSAQNEEGEDGSGEKSRTIADNAAERTGSLSGPLERDRRKVSINLSVTLWMALW